MVNVCEVDSTEVIHADEALGLQPMQERGHIAARHRLIGPVGTVPEAGGDALGREPPDLLRVRGGCIPERG